MDTNTQQKVLHDSPTEAEVQKNILHCYLAAGVQMAWMGADVKDVWKALGVNVDACSADGTPELVLHPAIHPHHVEEFFTFENVRNMEFAVGVMDAYRIAVYGEYGLGEYGHDELFTRVTDLLSMYANSQISEQIEGYGGSVIEPSRSLLGLMYLADARLILEGVIESTAFQRAYFDDNLDCNRQRELTIKQVAALSGMTHESLRAAANPKRANPLITKPSEYDGATVVDLDEARRWVAEKGLRISVKNVSLTAVSSQSWSTDMSLSEIHSAVIKRWGDSNASGNAPSSDELIAISVDKRKIKDLADKFLPASEWEQFTKAALLSVSRHLAALAAN
jgi:hypothetical protein